MRYAFNVLLVIACTFIMLSSPLLSNAQTPGSLTFSVTTSEPPGGYTGVHVIALWIEDTNGVFIKTKIRNAQARIQYLDHWIASSAYNVVDAVTGATLPSHGTLTFTWNGTDVAGNVVADKPYKVWIQMSDRNQSGAQTSVTFTKDTTVQHIVPADSGNFTNMVLDWNPTIGIDEIGHAHLDFTCDPNPVIEQASIHYNLSQNSDVTLSLSDVTGKTLALLFDDNQPAGDHMFRLSAREAQLKPGMYYLKINTGHIVETKKITIMR
jgi:hypothetical protein